MSVKAVGLAPGLPLVLLLVSAAPPPARTVQADGWMEGTVNDGTG